MKKRDNKRIPVMARRRTSRRSNLVSTILSIGAGLTLSLMPTKVGNLESIMAQTPSELLYPNYNIEEPKPAIQIKPEYGEATAVAYENPDVTKYTTLIERSALKYGFDPELIIRVIQRESGGDLRAISDMGAKGLMQLMPDVIKDYGVLNPYDPAQNIDAGCAHLRYYVDKFGGDIALGLAAYHAGHRRVVKALKPNTGRTEVTLVYDKFEQLTYHDYEVNPNRLTRTTRTYVKDILGDDTPGF